MSSMQNESILVYTGVLDE